MTKDDLDEIRKRCEAVTPGEWKSRQNGRHRGYVCVDENSPNGAEEIAHVFCGAFEGHGPANAEFIARARTDVPRLLDEVDRLQRERDAAWRQHDFVTERKKQIVANLERVDSRLALLEPAWEATKEWRLACARKDSTPEEVGGLWAVFVAAIDAAVAKEGK